MPPRRLVLVLCLLLLLLDHFTTASTLQRGNCTVETLTTGSWQYQSPVPVATTQYVFNEDGVVTVSYVLPAVYGVNDCCGSLGIGSWDLNPDMSALSFGYMNCSSNGDCLHEACSANSTTFSFAWRPSCKSFLLEGVQYTSASTTSPLPSCPPPGHIDLQVWLILLIAGATLALLLGSIALIAWIVRRRRREGYFDVDEDEG